MDEEEQEKLVTFHLDLSKVIFIWDSSIWKNLFGSLFPKGPLERFEKFPRKGFPPMMEKEGEKMAVFVALFEKSHNDLTLEQ